MYLEFCIEAAAINILKKSIGLNVLLGENLKSSSQNILVSPKLYFQLVLIYVIAKIVNEYTLMLWFFCSI